MKAKINQIYKKKGLEGLNKFKIKNIIILEIQLQTPVITIWILLVVKINKIKKKIIMKYLKAKSKKYYLI